MGKNSKPKGKQGKPQPKKEMGSEEFDRILQQHAAKNAKPAPAAPQVVPIGIPTARIHAWAVACSKRQLIYIFGGEYFNGDDNHSFSDLLVYDPNTSPKESGWNKIVSTPHPAARNSHQMVLIEDAIWVFGGESYNSESDKFKQFNDLWKFDLTTNKWSEVASKQKPLPRSGHRMISHGSNLVLFGGFQDKGKAPKYFNEVWVFETDKSSWRQVTITGPQPCPRSSCAVCSAKGFLCVLGGYAHPSPLNDTWTLNLSTWQWTQLNTSEALSTRLGINMATEGNFCYTFGGENTAPPPPDAKKASGKNISYKEYFNDLFVLDLTTAEWSRIAIREPPTPRAKALLCILDSKLYIIGGQIETNKREYTLVDCYQYNLKTKQLALKYRVDHLSQDWKDSDSEGDDEGEEEESEGETVDDEFDFVHSEDELPFCDGFEKPHFVPLRIAKCTKGIIDIVNQWHFSMLNDVPRNEFYERLFQRGIPEGKAVVLDVGSGSGLLSMLCARLPNVDEVYSVEVKADLAAVQREIVEENNLSSKITILNCLSTMVDKSMFSSMPNVLVFELFGTLMLGEKALHFVSDLRKRLKVPITVLPRYGVQYAALIECEYIRQLAWSPAAFSGIALGRMNIFKDTASLFYTKSLGVSMKTLDYKVIANVPIARVDFASQNPQDVEREVCHTVTADRKCTIDCIMYYWESFAEDGCPDVLSTDPRHAGYTPVRDVAWGQALQMVVDKEPLYLEDEDVPPTTPRQFNLNEGDSVTVCLRFSKDLTQIQTELIRTRG